MSEVATLTDVDLDLIHFVERFCASTGGAPTDAQINARYNLPEETLTAFKANPLVQKSFKVRGIMYPAAEDCFTPEQMHAAAAMTDLIDRRSDEKKLRDMGISSRQWSMWLQDQNFADYLRQRSELMLEHQMHEAHKGLMKGVRNGNVAAVKTYYEVTGRYRPNEEAQVDVRRILHTFIEIIQKYVKDPIILHNLAMDLSQAASAESLSTGLSNNMLAGAQNYRMQTIAGQAQIAPQVPAPPKFEEMTDG